MVEGLKFDFTTDELRALLSKRAEAVEQQRGGAHRLRFIAQSLIPDETYRLTAEDLRTLDLI